MGAINYGTSYRFVDDGGKRQWDKDITIGLKPMSCYDDEESGYADWLAEQKDFDEDFEESDKDRSEFNYNHDSYMRDGVEQFLEDNEMPSHYSISLESGYYEGFILKIENDIPWVFDDYEEKKEYQKDITVLKSVLLNLIKNRGLTVVHPGWCTGYTDEKDAVDEVSEFIRNLRDEVKSVDTFGVYQKKHKAA